MQSRGSERDSSADRVGLEELARVEGADQRQKSAAETRERERRGTESEKGGKHSSGGGIIYWLDPRPTGSFSAERGTVPSQPLLRLPERTVTFSNRGGYIVPRTLQERRTKEPKGSKKGA